MRTCARTAEATATGAAAAPPRPEAGLHSSSRHEAGFTLIEMLVAMVLLSLVGITLARFQTFQLSGASGLALSTAARLEADNLAVDVLAAPGAPTGPISGSSVNAGRTLHHSITPGPAPTNALAADLVRIDIAVSLEPGGEPVATRSLLRSRGLQLAVQ